MAFQSLTKIRSRTAKSVRSKITAQLTMSIYARKKGSHALVFRLENSLIGAAGLAPGDLVDIQIDREEGLGLVSKAEGNQGFTLSPVKSGKACTVSIQWCRGMPVLGKSVPCTGISLKDEGLLFELPEEAHYPDSIDAEYMKSIQLPIPDLGSTARAAKH